MKKYFLLAAIVLSLAACGGGSGGSDTGGKESVSTTAIVLGGTPSTPAFLDLDSKNAINNNSFNNYFKYAGVAGERLVLRVNLNTPLSDTEFLRCASAGGGVSSYSTKIKVYNSSNVVVGGVCGEDLTYTFTQNGVYIFNFEFPSHNSGFFNAASLQGSAPVKFLEAGSGSPSEPKKINTTATNLIESNVFSNYYWISAVKGEFIVINTTLNKPLTNQQKNRCAVDSDSHNSQIYVYNSKLKQVGLACGESLRFEIPESGNYIFQFHYGSQSAGVFNASKI